MKRLINLLRTYLLTYKDSTSKDTGVLAVIVDFSVFGTTTTNRSKINRFILVCTSKDEDGR